MRKTAKVVFSIVLLVILIFLLLFYFINSEKEQTGEEQNLSQKSQQNPYSTQPLSIEFQRSKSYPGSNLKIEESLSPGENYKQFIASYLSDGLKIYGLLAIPNAKAPQAGYPVIIFNHGYIPPEEYRTAERYVAYFSNLARAGYVVFKPDYRGNGNSEGKPEGAYFSPAYITDVMNALSSVKKLDGVNTKKIGMWGHSLGGFLTLRAMVLTKDIKVGVIWGGVVGSYQDMFDEWWSKRNRQPFTPSERERQSNRPSRDSFTKKYGQPNDNNEFWRAISTSTYLADISGPLQLHHGLSDETVPPALSQKAYNELKKLGKTVELYTYEGNDHNISQSFSTAMERTVKFFDTYLK